MKKSMLLITGLLVTVAVLFVNAMESENDGLEVGDVATGFELPNVDGKMVSLDSYKDAKGFVVIFTCNTCPYAKLYEQRIIELDKKYSGKGFPVIAINPNDISKQPGDAMEKMKERSSAKGYTFPYLRDDEQNVARAYGATKTPHVYVLNKEGNKLRVEYIGAIDDSPSEEADVSKTYVEDAINALLDGKKPAVTSKRAIGCTIKWKDA
ncbi:thioredoxin family protein [Marinoscillum furvescens]|uniref:AhpC/TSA family protein n=1 Tax=Marinoscillum furvescens DSM 4134 TaxID=1122208 RepID=A0A3D9L631_MARFU|nr:thioredoxin family protein [Marinoscillum furvescens]REE00428.1 AhpC/TSA family protein [Marinoscillum furvescens DSM 4134]